MARPDDADGTDVHLGPMAASPEDLLSAAMLIEALFDLLDATRRTHRERLLHLVEALDLHTACCRSDRAETVARDLRAVQRLSAVLTLSADWPDEPAMLTEALSQVTLAPPRGDAVIDVLSVLDARGLRWPHVFLLGCSEGQFPPGFREHALLGEVDRRKWIEEGVGLNCRSDLTAREMLLFYLAVSRPTASLTLSYLAPDAGGEAAGPGPFLEAALEPFDGLGGGCPLERIAPGQLVPPTEQIATQRDALAAGLAGNFSSDTPPSPAALAWAGTHLPETVKQAAMGLWAAHRRWQRGPCNEFDGRLSDPALLDVLAQRYPATEAFSARRLNAFGQCGWHYFGEYVCHLQPLAQPQRQLEAVAGGVFMHNLLYRVYRTLADQHGLPLRLWDLDERDVMASLDAAFAAECSRIESARPPYPALWQIQQQQLRTDATGYLLHQHRDPYGLRAECLHFELAFGTGRDDDLVDPASRTAPVEIETDAGPIQLVGKIDRIDRIHCLDTTGLLVVDYKTGKLPTARQAVEGTNVQMPLYTEAVRRLIDTGEPCLGGAFHGVSPEGAQEYTAAIMLHRGQIVANDAWDDEHRSAMQRIAEFIQAMQTGHFDLLPHPKPTSWDAFREVEHYSPVRAEIKQPAAEDEA
jgi:hypothetical protein